LGQAGLLLTGPDKDSEAAVFQDPFFPAKAGIHLFGESIAIGRCCSRPVGISGKIGRWA
jgi:hypothetical protein